MDSILRFFFYIVSSSLLVLLRLSNYEYELVVSCMAVGNKGRKNGYKSNGENRSWVATSADLITIERAFARFMVGSFFLFVCLLLLKVSYLQRRHDGNLMDSCKRHILMRDRELLVLSQKGTGVD